ncbi:MAG: hypothetical protein JSV91_13725 [Phycisphaerales bacterium]|nr:MAG: hypothetical protein JSV91_13725 [Phycisphaerales bacterium]
MTVFAAIAAIDLLFIAVEAFRGLGIEIPFEGLQAQLSLRDEGTLATWYSSALLLAAGFVALLNARYVAPNSAKPRTQTIGWAILALVLIGLSADEICQVHEWIGGALNRQLAVSAGTAESKPLPASTAWLLALCPVIAGVAVFMLLFFWRGLGQCRASRRLAFLGLACWVAVIVAEFVEGRASSAGADRGFQPAIEEGMEIIGTTLLLIAFTRFFRAEWTKLEVAAGKTGGR